MKEYPQYIRELERIAEEEKETADRVEQMFPNNDFWKQICDGERWWWDSVVRVQKYMCDSGMADEIKKIADDGGSFDDVCKHFGV